MPAIEPEQQPERLRVADLVGAIDLQTAIDLYDFSQQSAHRSANTMRIYRRVLYGFLRFVQETPGRPSAWRPPLTDLNVGNARLWLDAMSQSDRTISTLSVYASVLKSWGGWVYAEGYLTQHPLRQFVVPRPTQTVVKPFSAQQIEDMLLAAVRRPKVGKLIASRDVAVIYTLVDTGLRASELCALRRDDVDLRSRTGKVLGKVLGKGRKERPFYIDPTTATLLTRYLALRRDTTPWLFTNRTGEPLTTGALAHTVKHLGQLAGIVGIRLSPHTFRPTMACNYLARYPGQVLHLQLLLGHADGQMTRRYATRAEMDTRPHESVIETMGLDKALRRVQRAAAVLPRPFP